MTDLAARRADAVDTLAKARQESADAILSGKTPDLNAVATAAATVDALDLAETEATRRSRETQQAAWQARQGALRAEVQSALDARQGAVAAAEVACRALAAALVDEREASKALSTALAGLSVTSPLSLTKSERERRLAAYAVSVLKAAWSHPYRWGGIEVSGREAPAGVWADCERREVDVAVTALVKAKAKSS
jgi:hypothetical protein